MNWQQTYRGSRFYVGWMRGTFIYDNSIFLVAHKKELATNVEVDVPKSITSLDWTPIFG